MKKEVRKIILAALEILKKQEKLDFAMPDIEVEHPKNRAFGDYASNIAMVLAKKIGKNPLEVAELIAKIINQNLPADFEKAEVAKPAYINLHLAKGYLHAIVDSINELDGIFGQSDAGDGKKVLIEFISCNPTGPVHLGNGRGGPIGDILANVLEKSGYKVTREFYVNDFGNQVEMLGHSILKDELAQYKGEYIDELAKRRDKSLVDPMEIGNWAAGEIMENFIKPTCNKSNIRFDGWFSEKDLHEENKIREIVALLEEQKLTYEKDSALWYRSTKFGDDKDRVLKKSNGKMTYLVSDFAYHKNKIERGFDKIINIQGADHHKEAEVVKCFVEKVLGAKGKIDYILSQLVRVIKDGKEVKMSKRRGVYFALDDLIDEVGADAVRFIFASYSATSHINFDINLAKERSEKNPVYYVQYAHARICSILRKSDGLDFKMADLSLLTQEKELNIIRDLNEFPELIGELAQNYEIHKLPQYAIALADKFHSFYNEFLVLDEKNRSRTLARLKLVNSVRIVLAETLRLIGIKAPERMEREENK